MTEVKFMLTVVIAIVIVASLSLLLYSIKKRKDLKKDRLIELNCKFYLSEAIDETLDSYKEETGITIDGILGNDFLSRHGYIIDYSNLTVRHKSITMSIKESIEIIEIPIIVLYQGTEKYIFMLDTGAQDSMLHSKHVNGTFKIDKTEDSCIEIRGAGGYGKTHGEIIARLYYRKNNIAK